MKQTSRHEYRAGMPQLSYTGLSENWLLKICGQHHWDLLAKQSERQSSELYDDAGSRSYAAFTAIRLRATALDAVEEDMQFAIETDLGRVGQARHVSEHRVVCGDSVQCTIDMVSTFVKRTRAGSNRSIARATLSALHGQMVEPSEKVEHIANQSKALRAPDLATTERVMQDHALTPVSGDEASHRFLPCPNGDFNGADLLYFASFQAFADRAEWQRHRFDRPPVTVSRDLHFYGNVDLGDTLVVHTLGQRVDQQGVAHWCRVSRGSDGTRIAEIITRKRWKKQ